MDEGDCRVRQRGAEQGVHLLRLEAVGYAEREYAYLHLLGSLIGADEYE